MLTRCLLAPLARLKDACIKSGLVIWCARLIEMQMRLGEFINGSPPYAFAGLPFSFSNNTISGNHKDKPPWQCVFINPTLENASSLSSWSSHEGRNSSKAQESPPSQPSMALDIKHFLHNNYIPEARHLQCRQWWIAHAMLLLHRNNNNEIMHSEQHTIHILK